MAIDRDLGRRSPPMRSPGTIDDRARDIAPDGVPFNFYDSGRMDPPRRRFPDNIPPRFPMPSPMPTPTPPRFPRPMPMPTPMPGPRGPMMPATPMPGMGPFRQQPFPDQMPRGREMGIMSANKMSMPFDDDDYGPFIPPSVIEMDQFGIDYGPQDEYLFDKERGFENRIFGIDPNYFRGGIASLLQ
jgi:hypothetical protein